MIDLHADAACGSATETIEQHQQRRDERRAEDRDDLVVGPADGGER